MTDAIGQELNIGDYVTAVWANAEVALFEVVDLKENGRAGSSYRVRRGNVVVLKRMFNGKASEATQNKPVRKFTDQVTKVPTEAAQNYIIMFKLSN